MSGCSYLQNEVEIDELAEITNFLKISNPNKTDISDDITKLDQVRYLDLSSRNLRILPSCIHLMKNLVELRLINNNLTDLPETLQKMQSLRTLHLEGNKFARVPSIIFKMDSLLHIYLYGNPLTELPISLKKKIKSAPYNSHWVNE
jgi:Leucine-rich repeat (LRR) protein